MKVVIKQSLTTYDWSVVFYGSEAWTKEQKKAY